MLAMNYRGPYRVRATHKAEPDIEHPQDANGHCARSVVRAEEPPLIKRER